jgi:uncharacterized protein
MQNKDISVFRRNNLAASSSPYLVQHAGNPVWWQEWSLDVLSYAAAVNKPLFVSVGYSTCHWCHVMAAEAFSDKESADFLNEHFISIKIDREQRPDIDQFMMEFINRQTGSGGWPLNVFLTPSLRPVYALTYAPVKESSSMYSFINICRKVLEFYEQNTDKIPEFTIAASPPSVVGENSLVRILSDYYDPENGGFGNSHKFPPHSTLLYLLYQLGIGDSPSISTICTKTLDSMQLRGLHDHLQGGIYRYCVDPGWTIPHFEKMLYDQAMALWIYSLACRVTGRESYGRMAQKIIKCLEETFETNGLFISAHDADTDHHEGLTYLWSYDQLRENLAEDEFEKFASVYFISPGGNFEGMNHLLRKNDTPIDNIESRLLSIRKKRIQPSRDEKVLSGLNALTAIAMIHASRNLDMPVLEGRAAKLVKNIRKKFWSGNSLGHSAYRDQLQQQPFLFDAAALFYAVTLLCETDNDWTAFMEELAGYTESFRFEGKWIESKASDFPLVDASWFDHPAPSSVSLAETALTIYALHKGENLMPGEYRQPFQSDFYNTGMMIRNGMFHVFTSRDVMDWSKLPVNSVQVRGEHEQDCYMGVCSPLDGHGNAE